MLLTLLFNSVYYIRLGLCFDNGSLIDDDVDDDGRLYSAILRSLQQTHCARMWFYMSD